MNNPYPGDFESTTGFSQMGKVFGKLEAKGK